MKIVEVNMLHKGSTGRIMLNIAEHARRNNHEVWTFSPRYYEKAKHTEFPVIEGHTYFGYRLENMFHVRMSQLTGFHGCFSWFGTKNLIRKIKAIKPDVVHLHNLHNWTINIGILFKFLKRNNIKVVWTLHDCWSFTGQCPYYDMISCDKWKNGCHSCTKFREYPDSYVDRTKIMWKLKKKWFSDMDNMLIVTPSQWLANQVSQSFLKKHPVKVINNGIDLSVFKPSYSNFRKKHNISEEKQILLGVAFVWDKRKGLDVFLELMSRLDSKDYQFVLVGTDDRIDKTLPDGVVSIHNTQNQAELAEIYTAADLFVIPTREDNYPTVNMEALACGTPVITFNTGGSPECIDELSGRVVDRNDIDALEQHIRKICSTKPFSTENCIRRAESFDMNKRFEEYVKLYETIKV